MPHVVTQSCCADASCVVACPVNCIHPAPGEPGFATAEMLYVDAASCVDCGACTTACPADAIVPHTALGPAQLPFLAINADYYREQPHADRRPLALVPEQRRLRRSAPVRVAIVGAGPAGLYAADELLKHPEISVDVYDRLPTPYGLVRFGVAPDHPSTKQVQGLFNEIERQPGFRYFLGVEVGSDVHHEELVGHYHAVIYTVGAASDRRLAILGDDLAGSVSATDFVGWYNAHPDKQDLRFDLGAERAVVVGNGNVALDCARIMTIDPSAHLDHTDIGDPALAALHDSNIREVVVLGRRGWSEAAFTVPELVGLAGRDDINVVVDTGGVQIEGDSHKARLMRQLQERAIDATRRTIVLRFLASPVRILGQDRVTGVELTRNRVEAGADGRLTAVSTGETEILDAGLVLRAVGYHGLPVPGLPYDASTGTVPHHQGRVEPGVYVSGWIKRGPNGFIGTNKSDSEETVASLLDDADAGLLRQPVATATSVESLIRQRRPDMVDLRGWQAIEREERRRGLAAGRPRVKVTEVAQMRRIAHANDAEGRNKPAAVIRTVGKVAVSSSSRLVSRGKL